ncbi:MAG TPA: glycosyltransferase family 2 protein [Holophaga sp.]|nr:glycosyltransferase family 2 protein [Holophaga sp.]
MEPSICKSKMNMSTENRLTVGIAIPTYNREEILVKTLEQVFTLAPLPDEILVVDQTKQHNSETIEYLAKAEKIEYFRWIKHGPPNLNSARNRAIIETKCDILVFIDDDVIFNPSFLEKHSRNFYDQRVIAVCGRVIQARGNLPQDRQQPWLNNYTCNKYNGWGEERVEGIAGLWGGNHSIRVNVIREIGGFDDNFFGYLYDESDLALRLWKKQKLIIYDPEAQLLHLGVSTGGCRTSGNAHPEYWMSFSTIYFHMKHFFPKWYFWKQIFGVQFRRRALRKEIVFSPWKIPWAVLSYVYSLILAAKIYIRTHNKENYLNIHP